MNPYPQNLRETNIYYVDEFKKKKEKTLLSPDLRPLPTFLEDHNIALKFCF